MRDIIDAFDGEFGLSDFCIEVATKEGEEGDFADGVNQGIDVGFAVGYDYGRMFDVCNKDLQAAAGELGQELIDKGLLKYRPKKKKEGSATQKPASESEPKSL